LTSYNIDPNKVKIKVYKSPTLPAMELKAIVKLIACAIAYTIGPEGSKVVNCRSTE
jgi:hypothetical protein